MVDFQLLNDHLNAIALTVLEDIVPGGKLRNNEYVAGSELGGPGDSFSYNIKKHCGSDFASGFVCSDLISLYAKSHNVTMIESAKYLANRYNFIQPEQNSSRPNLRHRKYGDPIGSWEYFFANGSIAFVIARYQVSPEKKTYLPFSKNPDGSGWRVGLDMNERPLYKLLSILINPEKQIIICEGEKSADACQRIVGDRAIVTTWSTGCQSVNKTDFSPLHGRKIIIWPDADIPGVSAAHAIKNKLSKYCKSLAIVDVSGFPECFDAADFNGTWSELQELIKTRAKKTHDNREPSKQISNQSENKSENETPKDEPLFKGSLHSVWETLGLGLSQNGTPIANLDNVCRILERCDDLCKNIWYDMFYKRYYLSFRCKPREWINIDDSSFTKTIQREFGISRISTSIVHDAIRLTAYQNRRCDPIDYLNTIVWDGVPRIDTLFPDSVYCVNSMYTRAVSRNFMLSLVARLLKPGCKHDTMVILEGGQGKRKSSFFEAIAGRKWYTQAIESVHSNNFYQCLNGKLIIEFAELHQFAKADILKVKQLLANAIDTYRAPYDREPEDHPRMSVFSGTTNESIYLRDDTGARRFWPIKIGDNINLSYVYEFRDQLFAEACSIFKSENPEYDSDRTISSWWNVPTTDAEHEQEERRVRDPWQEDIENFIAFKESTTTSEILETLFKIEKRDKTKNEEMRIASILHILGWERFADRQNGKINRAWRRVETF